MVISTIKWSLKERILKYLLENKESKLSIREISRVLKSDYKNTFEAIKSFPKELIKMEKAGGSWIISLNLYSNKLLYLIESKRTEELLIRHPKLKLIQKEIQELAYPFVIVLVFGSYAKKLEDKNSDLDLCVISDSLNMLKEFEKRFGLSTLKIELQEFSTKEFTSMLEKRPRNLGHEIVKNNIILFGAEGYYNLISKWTMKE